MWLLLLGLVFLYLFFFYAWKPIMNYFRLLRFAFRIPTASGALPLVGHGYVACKDNSHLFDFVCQVGKEATKGDGIIKVWIGPCPMFVVTDPDAYVAIANTCLGKAFIYKYLDPLFGGSILTANASLWRRSIKMVHPAFSSKEIVNFLHVVNKHARLLIKDMEPNVGHSSVSHKLMIAYATLRMIFESSFGFTLEEEKISCQEYKDYLKRGSDWAMKRLRQPWFHLDFLYRNSALKSEADEIVGILQKASFKVLKRVTEAYAKGDNNKAFRPFLELLLKNSANGAISNEQMRAEIDGIIITGFETTSNAIVYALMLLGANPDSQEKVYRELTDIYGDSDRDVAKEDLAQMIYLEAAIKETLRIFPNVPFTGRELDRDMQFKKYRLPAGATVLLSHWEINRQKCWGADVLEFKPERWLDKATLPSGLTPRNTFGVGIRSCVGKIYAIVTMKAVLAHVLRRYKVTASTEGIQFQFAFSLQPVSDVAIRVELR